MKNLIKKNLMLNGWIFVFELNGCGLESRCSHLFQSIAENKLGYDYVKIEFSNEPISYWKNHKSQ